MKGYATGGRFIVGGTGGPDSKLAMFRVSPQEEVTIRTPAQQQHDQALLRGQIQQTAVIASKMDVMTARIDDLAAAINRKNNSSMVA